MGIVYPKVGKMCNINEGEDLRVKQERIFVGDFETTVYKGQKYTEVWASACVEIGTDDVQIFHSIGEQFDYFKSLNCNICCYYHNLKFDGTFWLYYFLINLGFKQASYKYGDGDFDIAWLEDKDMPNNSVKYCISDMGQWYNIVVKVKNRYITFRDSFKLLPFALRKIGKSFQTKHQKLEMEYEGFRYAGCEITEEEQKYIANDVLVIKEALEIMFSQGHNKLTIGSCCLAEYRKIIGNNFYKERFPDLTQIGIDPEIYGARNADEYIRKAYHGGWCYVVKGKENQIKTNGTTADVNSLYPSMMSSQSGNRYPVGEPTFWSGNYIPDVALKRGAYYYVRIRTRFYLKEGYLPFIQIKSSLLYPSTVSLETSDVYDTEQGYVKFIRDFSGEIVPTTVTMTLTWSDFELIKEHYDLVDFEILDGCYFQARIGIFDEYIEKYKRIKQTSTGAVRELAKLFLNNLYGKMAANNKSNFKYAYIKEDKTLGFNEIRANDKKAGYIAVGAAITSYAKCFTVRAAQQNFYGADKRGFIYADTDSIHCDLPVEQIKGIKIHDTEFCCWKIESEWDIGLFARQKTYIEHIVKQDGEVIEPYYSVKCAGMPDRCKALFVRSMTDNEVHEDDKFTEEEIDFITKPRTLDDFKVGLKIPSKLLPKRIQGGVVLVSTTYEMRAYNGGII